MEAALLLPVLLWVVALLLQPVCLLYTQTVMGAAAAEGVRVLQTRSAGVTEDQVRAFVLRRLGAVPELGLFHEGEWEVRLEGQEGVGECAVTVHGRARPLPLMGWLVHALGPGEDGCVALEERVCAQVRPGWLEGSYEQWKGSW